MRQSYFHTENTNYFIVHSELKAKRPTIIFLHGLDDSSISYYRYLNSLLSNSYNILIPDLLGYGKSSCSSNYSFQHQILGIEQHIKHLQKMYQLQFDKVLLVAHSMGGIHATLLCNSSLKNSIKALINVEGSITQFGSFIAEKMMTAIEKNNFLDWFNNFKDDIYETLTKESIHIRPYYASLEFCDPDAFLNNAIQMYQMSKELPGKYTHVIGKKYIELTIPRIYCYGDSMAKETITFLQQNHLESHYFPCKNHFLLAENSDEFITFIDAYIKKHLLN